MKLRPGTEGHPRMGLVAECLRSFSFTKNGACHAGRPMNKTQFVSTAGAGDGVTPRQAERALNAVLDTIARSVLRRTGRSRLWFVRHQAAACPRVRHRKTATNCLCMNQAP
ncbi:MAG: hypothetical protein ACLT8E_10245 [Akkermansia sp.]